MEAEEVKRKFMYMHPSYDWENDDATKVVDDVLTVSTNRYQVNNALAVIITYGETGEDDVVSVNFPGTDLEDGEFIADVNNCRLLIEAMEEAGIIQPTGGMKQTRFVTYPVYRLVGYAEHPEVFGE